jgi:hypothetical protein
MLSPRMNKSIASNRIAASNARGGRYRPHIVNHLTASGPILRTLGKVYVIAGVHKEQLVVCYRLSAVGYP